MSPVIEQWREFVESLKDEDLSVGETFLARQRYLNGVGPEQRDAIEQHERLQQAARDTAERLRKDNARRTFLAAFRCPDTSGVKAPCRSTITHGVVSGFEVQCAAVREWHPCPVADEIQCAPIVRLRHEQWNRTGHEMGLPADVFDASFSAAATTDALTRARRYIDDEARHGLCLVLTGGVGVGKTYAASAALRAFGAGRFVSFPAFTRATLDPDERKAAWTAVTCPALVVLDDAGIEFRKDGGFVETQIEELFWHREAHRLPTIVTTNLTPERLREHFSERVVDRLRGRWGRLYIAQGESMRRKASA